MGNKALKKQVNHFQQGEAVYGKQATLPALQFLDKRSYLCIL
jgi:hypothetical protein